MLGVFVNGIRLDLSPGTTAQVQRTSPFFAKDSLANEISLPLTFPYSPKNAKALGLTNHFYTRREKKKVPGVKYYDRNNFAYTGDLIIEAAELDINDITQSTITGYFFTGVSSFFNAIK